jgi:soluble lytic murein transglycosylase-like protein
MLQTAADANNVDPALLAAIGIRETGFQNIPQSGGGQGAGIFQIDLGQNPNVTSQQAFNPAWAANFAANMLDTNMDTLAAAYPNLNQNQLLQATAASYNFGTGNISGNPNTIDVGTTGGNYGESVASIMDCF